MLKKFFGILIVCMSLFVGSATSAQANSSTGVAGVWHFDLQPNLYMSLHIYGESALAFFLSVDPENHFLAYSHPRYVEVEMPNAGSVQTVVFESLEGFDDFVAEFTHDGVDGHLRIISCREAGASTSCDDTGKTLKMLKFFGVGEN